jgi:hypothetical protein
MLPHVYAEDRNFTFADYRVLIFGCDDGKSLFFACLDLDEPAPAAALDAEECCIESLFEFVLVAPRSSGAALLLASAELAGARFCQKSEWLMCPPALNLIPCCSATCEGMSFVFTASA